MNSTIISIDERKFTIIHLDNTDQVLYEIYEDKNPEMLCLLGLNEEGNWESNCSIPDELLKKIGDAIEQNEI